MRNRYFTGPIPLHSAKASVRPGAMRFKAFSYISCDCIVHYPIQPNDAIAAFAPRWNRYLLAANGLSKRAGLRDCEILRVRPSSQSPAQPLRV
jgi:hypothetical protein